MIVVMNGQSTREQVDHVVDLLDGMGASHYLIDGPDRKIVEVLGVNGCFKAEVLEGAPMVERVVKGSGPFLAAGRGPDDQTAEIPLGARATVGGRELGVIAGPCCVESRDQMLEIAAAVSAAGATGLRGGAFKPRTSPYSFQGHAQPGLEWLAEARDRTGLAIVTEVMRCEHVGLVAEYADVLQIGSRNMHNYPLLTAVGQQSKPVLLKRGWSSTLDEFLMAAEYIMLEGNPNVILCERGIRTHETYVRNTLALAVVPEIKHVSTLPIIVDPSHGTGRPHLVSPMSKASVACGADGLLIEVHQDPKRAWTDSSQQLDLKQFASLMSELDPIARCCERALGTPGVIATSIPNS